LVWFYPTFGAATSPKHWHVLFLSIKQREGSKGTNGRTKEKEKRWTDPLLPHAILPFLDCSTERTPKYQYFGVIAGTIC
jgi:hypothetical protein